MLEKVLASPPPPPGSKPTDLIRIISESRDRLQQFVSGIAKEKELLSKYGSLKECKDAVLEAYEAVLDAMTTLEKARREIRT